MGEFASLNPDVWSRKNHSDQVKYVDFANAKWGVIESTQEIAWADAPSRARRILKDGDTVVGTVRPGNGSQATNNEVPSIHAYLSNLRKDLISKRVLEAVEGSFRFTQDYPFGSPSTASGVCLGRASNGRTEWKTMRASPLKGSKRRPWTPHDARLNEAAVDELAVGWRRTCESHPHCPVSEIVYNGLVSRSPE